MFKQSSLRGVVAAVALASASVAAQAATTTNLNFDSVASGTSANDYLASLGINGFTFADANRVDDEPVYDNNGFLLNDGAFHWETGSNVVQVKSVSDFWTGADLSVSKSNLLWNDNAPILIQFKNPIDILSFSIQQDLSTYGAITNTLSFLDASGHVIAGANVDFEQYNHPGQTISSGAVNGVSAILLPGITHWDNLSLVTAAPVPEPSTWAMGLVAMGLMGAVARRRQPR